MIRILAVFVIALSAAVPAAAQTDYVIGAHDVLTITVFGEADFSGKYTVEQDGTFTYPQLGRVKAGGLTLRAVEQELKKQLADGFLRNPQVGVAIEEYKSQQILVLGEVRSPGSLQLNAGMTVLAAIAKAGYTTPNASAEVLIVRRNDQAAEAETIRVNLARIQSGDLTQDVVLRADDQVHVQKAQQVFVYGEVKSPGGHIVQPGTTVLQMLSLAGGLTDRGSDNRISIKRTAANGKETEVRVRLIDLVQPGDTIIVGTRRF
jgi:polysaccharide biosynthesis/export protein